MQIDCFIQLDCPGIAFFLLQIIENFEMKFFVDI